MVDSMPQNQISLKPNPQVQAPVIINPESFRANPVQVASEHNTNQIVGALGLGILGGVLGHVVGKNQSSYAMSILAGTALGGVGGALLGHHLKTAEESRSESLMSMARSDDFAGHLKREMARREDVAELKGALWGAVLFWR